jgi:hypothetical protein
LYLALDLDILGYLESASVLLDIVVPCHIMEVRYKGVLVVHPVNTQHLTLRPACHVLLDFIQMLLRLHVHCVLLPHGHSLVALHAHLHLAIKQDIKAVLAIVVVLLGT